MRFVPLPKISFTLKPSMFSQSGYMDTNLFVCYNWTMDTKLFVVCKIGYKVPN